MRCAPRLIAIAAAACLAANLNAATVSYTGGTYTQNFDGLTSTGSGTFANRGPNDIDTTPGVTNTGVTGWSMSNPTGSSATTEFRAQDGSASGATGRGVVSFGTNLSGERALGTLATSNQINRFGVTLTNNSGSTITGFNLNFTVEQWRRGEVIPGNSVPYDYMVASSGTDNIDSGGFSNIGTFATPNNQTTLNVAMDGNLPANQAAAGGTVSNISWAPGANLILRWTGSDLSGQDNGLAIDNLSFSAVPEPTSCLLALSALFGAMLIRRR